MTIPSLQEYVDKTRVAIFSNPPRNNPAYQDDPAAMWRYYMRNFGAGLTPYKNDDVQHVVSGLYSSWFMRLEFNNNNRPDIDAKEFFGWIYSGREDAK
jgi:hypothetical protein